MSVYAENASFFSSCSSCVVASMSFAAALAWNAVPADASVILYFRASADNTSNPASQELCLRAIAAHRKEAEKSPLHVVAMVTEVAPATSKFGVPGKQHKLKALIEHAPERLILYTHAADRLTRASDELHAMIRNMRAKHMRVLTGADGQPVDTTKMFGRDDGWDHLVAEAKLSCDSIKMTGERMTIGVASSATAPTFQPCRAGK